MRRRSSRRLRRPGLCPDSVTPRCRQRPCRRPASPGWPICLPSQCPAPTTVPTNLATMRISPKAEYAVRAMVQLATVDDGVLAKTDDLAKAQGIPPQFLVDIISDLRNDRLVRSHRGRDGGYELARPAGDISIAD